MRILFSCVLLLTALAFSGCGTAPERRLDAPAVRVTRLSTVGEGHVLTLRILNPNATPLVVSRSTHIVSFGEQRIARIEDPQPIGIPSLGSVEHAVALPSKSASEASAWLAKNQGEVPVTVETSFELVIGSDNDSMTLRSVGTGVVKQP